MRFLKIVVNQTWEKIIIVCGVLSVLLPTSPLNMPLTFRDSGVFLYIGWRILNGELPYRDIWDHKPPVIFYINSLGLALANGSRWGVWFLEFISLSFAVFIGFHLIKKLLGIYPAIFSSLLWLFTLIFLIQGGNSTTEYTLPLQFAVLWLIYDANRPDLPYRRWFLIGFLGGIAFFTKQTAIGIWLAISLYLTIDRLIKRQITKLLKELLTIFAGGFTVCMGWAIFFALQGAFAQFWSDAFAFNFFYSSSKADILSRLSSIINGLAPFKIVWLLHFSIIGMLIGIILIFFKKNTASEWIPIIAISLLDLPIELFLIGFSGRSFLHYYITLLPVFSIFAGLAIWGIISALFFWRISVNVKFLCLLGIAGILLGPSAFNAYKEQISDLRYAKNPTMLRYIRRNSSPKDDVLLWGAESALNYFTQRNSPTRFVYQYPLYTQGYANEQMISEFLSDILKNCPSLIIDTHNPETPIYDFPVQTKATKEQIALIQSRYLNVGDVGSWTVYKYNEKQCYP